MSTFSPLLRKLKRPAGAAPIPPPQIEEQDAEPTIPVGVKGVMAATEKLLAVNRGLAQPDIRDSMQFKHLMTTDKLLRERIRMDADRVRQSTLRRVARTRNLKSISPGAFDSYGTGLIVGNQLSMPLEEINPMHLVEQARRISHMGQGGLGSDEAISADSQNVYADQFGYISPIEGPESARAGVDVRLAWGVKIGSDGRLYQKLYDKRAKAHRWMSPQDLDGKTVAFED